MKDFFASIYELFIDVYGDDLAKHMYGWDGTSYTDAALYSIVGLYVLIGSSLGVAILFYYLINSTFFSRWYHWLIILVVNFVINLGFGYYIPYLDYRAGNIADDLVVEQSNIWGFGFVNALWSFAAFMVFSLVCILATKAGLPLGQNTQYTPYKR